MLLYLYNYVDSRQRNNSIAFVFANFNKLRLLTSRHAPIDQKRFVNITHLARCLEGKNSAYKVTLCGAPPIPNPTKPLNISSQMNMGAKADSAPK
jgi:hypothetical protein